MIDRDPYIIENSRRSTPFVFIGLFSYDLSTILSAVTIRSVTRSRGRISWKCFGRYVGKRNLSRVHCLRVLLSLIKLYISTRRGLTVPSKRGGSERSNLPKLDK